MSRRAAVVHMSRDNLATMLGLPTDVGVEAVRTDPFTDRVEVLVTGQALPDVAEGSAPPAITLADIPGRTR
jgi:hypothetical protein